MPNRVKLPPFNRRLYRKRNIVERFFNKLKHFRAIATRYDKRDETISPPLNSPPFEFGCDLMSR